MEPSHEPRGGRDVRGPSLRTDRRVQRRRAHPTLIPAWSLSNTEAGWISGIYYAAYTLTVPLLSSLTDRVDPKRIYLGSVALTRPGFRGFAWVATGFWSALAFRALMGVGWAGSYMPGLKALSDVAEGPQHLARRRRPRGGRRRQRRALLRRRRRGQRRFGWQWACAGRARGRPGLRLRADRTAGPPPRAPRRASRALLDFRPILRNRSALAYSIAYGVHTWEMSALRAWVVTFLTFAAAQGATAARGAPAAPATVASVMGLLGVWASVWGNELAIRLRKARSSSGRMLASAALAA